MASTPNRLRGQELLRAVAEGTAGAVGEEFLRCLARNVAEAFAAKMVLIAEASRPLGHAREGADVLERRRLHRGAVRVRHRRHALRRHHRLPVGVVPGGADRALPRRPTAVEFGLNSYVAVCLRSSEDVHLGHIAVLDERQMEASEEDVAALRIFAARASAELERQQQARALEASRARVIDAADAERRRVGRDLHDGAQQRLLAVSNLLRVARMKADEPAEELLAAAAEELDPGARGAARARARPAPGRAVRARPAGGARVAVRVVVDRGRARHHRGRAARRDRGRRLLRRGGVARQHGALCAGEPRRGARAAARRRAARRDRRRRRRRRRHRRAAPASPASATASRCSSGCLDVDSPPGGGTRVHASIPLAA